MKLTLERLSASKEATLGRLYLDGRPECWTLEDQFQAGPKVAGETRIPDGTFDIKLRKAGGMLPKYQARYGVWHTGMLHLQGVPGFKYIYIHTGNTDDHTEGCILVGAGCVAPPGGDPTVTASRPAYEKLARVLIPALEAGERVTITIENRDG